MYRWSTCSRCLAHFMLSCYVPFNAVGRMSQPLLLTNDFVPPWVRSAPIASCLITKTNTRMISWHCGSFRHVAYVYLIDLSLPWVERLHFSAQHIVILRAASKSFKSRFVRIGHGIPSFRCLKHVVLCQLEIGTPPEGVSSYAAGSNYVWLGRLLRRVDMSQHERLTHPPNLKRPSPKLETTNASSSFPRQAAAHQA